MTSSTLDSFFNAENFPDLRRKILAWFARNGRKLPWRNLADPYRVWVSEIMLQQTTTETVTGYFDRFIARFPTVSDLAEAEMSEVLKYWEGLGYYRRARQLYEAAKIICGEYSGKFPKTQKGWESLPGIGRYTAGAIRSFAFNQRAPILEANTTRLHARILALEEEPIKSGPQKILWQFAEAILPKKNPGDFNQALIDLGRLVCLPEKPRCSECPCRLYCQAAAQGRQHLIPPPKQKPLPEFRTEAAFLIRRSFFSRQRTDDQRFLFIRYPEGLRWAGLWDFPRFLAETSQSAPSFRSSKKGEDGRGTLSPKCREELTQRLAAFLDSDAIKIGGVLKELSHCVTRFKIRLLLCDTQGEASGSSYWDCPDSQKVSSPKRRAVAQKTVVFAGGETTWDGIEFKWLTLAEAAEIPLNSTGRRLVDDLKKRFGDALNAPKTLFSELDKE